MSGGSRVLAAALVLLSALLCGVALAQDRLPQCPDAQAQRLAREQKFGELLERSRAQLKSIDRRTDKTAFAVVACLRAQIGESMSRLGRTKDAVVVLATLVPEARARLGREHPETLSAELFTAQAYGRAGDNDARLQFLDGVRPRIAKVHGADSTQMRGVLTELVSAHRAMGSFAEALPIEREALAIAERELREDKCRPVVDCRAALVRRRLQLADTLRRVGRAAEARPLAEEALRGLIETLGPTHATTLDARLVLALVHATLGDSVKALEINREVLEAAERRQGAEHAVARTARSNVTIALAAAGKAGEARELETKHLAQMRERFGPNHPETLTSLAAISDRLLRAGDVDTALPLLEEALTGMLAARSGLAFDDHLVLAWQAQWRRVVDDYVYVLLRKGRVADAFLVTEHFKARLLSDRLSLDPAERALSEEERATLRRMKRAAASLEQTAALKRSLGARRDFEEAARGALLKRIAEFRPAAAAPAALPSAKRAPDWYTSLDRAEKDSARVSYVVLRGGQYAFVDRGGKVQPYFLGDAGAVRDTIEAYRTAMRAGLAGGKPAPLWKRAKGGYTATKPRADPEEVKDPALLLGYLSEVLILPLAAELQGKSRLLVSPYDALAYAPFDALTLEGARLGERLEVIQMPSFALHAQLVQRVAEYGKLQRRPFLGFGGAPTQRASVLGAHIIVFKERELDIQAMDMHTIAQMVRKDPSQLRYAFATHVFGMQDLPGSLDEVRTIARRIGGEAFYLGEDRASEENLNRLADDGELAKYRVVHFAAHGFLSDDEPALSAIVLSQINRAPGTDGYLTVAEISALELRTDLVVLSACDSGIGKLQHGEGLLGMSYALFQAGTVSSMVTLWPVLDRESARLMTRFYEELEAPGAAPSRALAAAKRWALANGISARTVDAFVLFGT
jgi:CHAT domain-containing protein/tetratricopeptide (TPR) repeat protein